MKISPVQESLKTLISKSNEKIYLLWEDYRNHKRPYPEGNQVNIQQRKITIQRNLSKIMASHKYNEIVDQVREMYIQGLSKRKISAHLDVDMDQIGYILYVQLKIHEEFPRRQTGADLIKALPNEKINKIITLYSFGYNTKEIAIDQNISQTDISKIIKEAKEKKLIKKV